MKKKSENKNSNIIRFHRNIQLNVGMIICTLILIYLLFHIFTYSTSKNISIYEVNEGSITYDDKYTALAIRQEEIMPSDRDGNVYYFSSDRSRVGVRSLICSIDSTGEITNLLSNYSGDNISLSDTELSSFQKMFSEYVTSYSDKNFNNVYVFKTTLKDSLDSIRNNAAQAANQDAIVQAEGAGTYFPVYAPKPGLLVLKTDGYEGVTLDNFTPDMFNKKSYSEAIMTPNMTIKNGDALYKLVTDDNWSIVMPVSEKLVTLLGDTQNITVKFAEDNATASGVISYANKDGQTYLIVTFDDSMERYADFRFLDVTLMLDQKKGLKIPNSSIVKKSFFGIPKKYVKKSDDGSDDEVQLDNGSKEPDIINPTFYYEDENFYYTDSEVLKKGDVLISYDTGENYKVGTDIDEKQGVYCVNKGYALFKIINIMSSNDDYTIVEKGTDYGIANYDRIILNGSDVKENDLLY